MRFMCLVCAAAKWSKWKKFAKNCKTSINKLRDRINIIKKNYIKSVLKEDSDVFIESFRILSNNQTAFFLKLKSLDELYKINLKKSFFEGESLTNKLQNEWKNCILDSINISFKNFMVILRADLTKKMNWTVNQKLAIFKKLF